MNPFRGLAAVFYKETLHIRRDPRTVIFALAIPVMQMVFLGFAIDTNVRQVHTVVYDADGKPASRDLLDRFRNTDTYKIIRYVHSDEELHDFIVSGRAKVGIKIPVDFSDQLQDRGTAQVLVLIDGSDSSVAGQALNVSTSLGLDESLRRVLERFNLRKEIFPVEVRPRLLFNPDSRSPNFFLPGLTAVLLLSLTTFLTALGIVKEKEKGTLEQLFVTPVRPLGMLLGKLLPYLGIGFFGLCLMLTFIRFVFQVPINGQVPLLLLLALPYIFVNLSIGLIISGKANSQAEGMQLALLVFLPTIFFSGYIFPRETMPLPFYLFSFVVPGTYFVNIARGIILRGAGLQHLWIDGAVLLAMGITLLLLAARRFHRKIIAP